MANSQSPFGTPPASPPVKDPPVNTRDLSGQVAAIPHAPDHGRHFAPPERAAPAPPPEQDTPPPPHKRRRRGWLIAFTIALLLCFTAGFGLQWWSSNTESAAPPPQPSHSEDPVPQMRDDGAVKLAHQELFARDTAPNGYSLDHSQQLPRCLDAASANVASLLESSGCNQVVRAVLTRSDSPYVITVGVANLDSSRSAQHAHSTIESSHEAAFHSAYEPPAEPQNHGGTMLGFNTFGHYLLYAVIADTGNTPSGTDQGEVQQIVSELVDDYLVTRLEKLAADD